MNNIFFSIIVPTYNRANLLPKTLATLLAQSYKNYEIIVVDDGSTDNTAQIMQEWVAKGVIYHQKNNEERAVARNTGVKMAKGDYINFFDSDDLAYPNHLETANNFIQKNENIDVFHLGYDFKNPEGLLDRKVDNFSGNTLNEQLIQGNILSCNGVFLRKDVILKHNFVEDRVLAASEDYELWLRLAALYPIKYDNTITSTVIDHEGRSVLNINKEKLIARLEVFMKYLFIDKKSNEKYAVHKSFLQSECYTYISLHLALTKKHRLGVIRYVFKAFFVRPAVIARRRFWASLKHLL